MNIVDKFIADISNKLEFIDMDIIPWEFYEKKFDLKGSLGYYDELHQFKTVDSVEWIINTAFNANPNNCINMLEYICYKNYIEFDFTEIKEEINLLDKEISFDFPEEDLENLRVFISYCTEDGFSEAKRIYNIFKNANVYCFLAKEDIKVGENWDDKIFNELIKADVYVLIISKKYKESAWCNQEASIAYLKREFNDSIVIPLLTDKTTPYGIFYSIQGISSNNIKNIEDLSKVINSTSISLDDAVNNSNIDKYDEIDEYIHKLKDSESFQYSNEIFRKFKFKTLSNSQIETICDFASLNSQILGSWEFEKFVKKYDIDEHRFDDII